MTGFGAILVLTFLALAAVWQARFSVMRAAMVLLFVLGTGLSLYAWQDALGRPKPVRMEMMRSPGAEVIGHRLVEGEAIYLWLLVPGEAAPIAYSLPWDTQLAVQLKGAVEEGGEAGVVMSQPFERTSDRTEQVFHPPPPPAYPAKEIPEVPLVANN